MNESEQRAIEQVKVLWPYLTFNERWEWVERLQHLFNYSFTATVTELSQTVS